MANWLNYFGKLKEKGACLIDWVGTVFTRPPDKEMRGLEWARLYELYHSNSYSAAAIERDLEELRSDDAVQNLKGIYEYLLGGKSDPQLLTIRLFDDATKNAAYKQQTKRAKDAGVSNCPTCAGVDNANKARIYTLGEMEADHVAAWSKGGATDLKNCEMLCVTHNRAKGNK